MRTSRLPNAAAAVLITATMLLAGCGGSEPKVQIPENPTPVPRPEDRLKPLGTAPPQQQPPGVTAAN